jgi:hypothetical protein
MQYFYGLLWLLTVHFIADFILQSDWMAQNKSKSNKALGLHVAAYTAALLVGTAPLAFILQGPVPIPFLMAALWVSLNGAAHFATDYITSRINSRLWAAKNVHWFFVGVGFDQLIHAWTLGLTMVWLLR